jgi:hypothetical protein
MIFFKNLIFSLRTFQVVLICLLVRLAYWCLSPSDVFQLNTDSIWLSEFSDKAAQGNFNFDHGHFILSPAFVFIAAGFKLLFSSHWTSFLVLFQILVASVAGGLLYRLARLMYNQKVASLTAWLYAIFPFTMWWVFTMSTESLFGSLFIIALYFLVLAQKKKTLTDLIFSAVFFSFAFLTKSHILLFAPFIVVWFFLCSKRAQAMRFALVYAGVCALMALPWALYNARLHHVYVLSSNGGPLLFYVGNSEFGYHNMVDVPPRNTEDFEALQSLNFGYYNADFDSIIALPQSQKQPLFFHAAMHWIRSHPKQFAEIKLANALTFLAPGFSYRHYAWPTWLMSVLLCLPIYFFAYWKLGRIVKTKRREEWIWVFLFLTMLGFSVVFYTQNRFRSITIEPVYLMLASAMFLEWRQQKEISRDDRIRP